jgi:hypothetical protein
MVRNVMCSGLTIFRKARKVNQTRPTAMTREVGIYRVGESDSGLLSQKACVRFRVSL